MTRKVAGFLLLIFVCVFAVSILGSEDVVGSISAASSTVVGHTEEGAPITLRSALVVAGIFFTWLVLGILLTIIDSNIGYLYFYYTAGLVLNLVAVALGSKEGFKLPEPKRGGGSGNTNRTG